MSWTIQPSGDQPHAASMIQVTEPIITAIRKNAAVRTRSITAPETMEPPSRRTAGTPPRRRR